LNHLDFQENVKKWLADVAISYGTQVVGRCNHLLWHTDGGQMQPSLMARVKQQLEERYAQEETLWHQKLRIQWLKEGGGTPNFFTDP
jgi:hypothetical protein